MHHIYNHYLQPLISNNQIRVWDYINENAGWIMKFLTILISRFILKTIAITSAMWKLQLKFAGIKDTQNLILQYRTLLWKCGRTKFKWIKEITVTWKHLCEALIWMSFWWQSILKYGVFVIHLYILWSNQPQCLRENHHRR